MIFCFFKDHSDHSLYNYLSDLNIVIVHSFFSFSCSTYYFFPFKKREGCRAVRGNGVFIILFFSFLDSISRCGYAYSAILLLSFFFCFVVSFFWLVYIFLLFCCYLSFLFCCVFLLLLSVFTESPEKELLFLLYEIFVN